MTAGHAHPSDQPGQRALRLVPLPPSVSPSLQRLQRELEAAKAEAHSLHELLEELPAILEKKYQLRLHALLSEQRQLEQDNALLQHHLMAVLRGGDGLSTQPNALPPAPKETGSASTPDDSPITRGLGLRRALRHLRR